MYKKDLDLLLQKDSLPKAMLLYGEEFFCSFYMDKIILKLADKDNILRLYFDEYDFSLAKSFLSQPSLFSDTNFLHIKTDKKIPKKDLKELIDISRKNQNSFFYLEFLGEDRVAKELSNTFLQEKNADFVRFFKPNFHEAIFFLSEYAKKYKINIKNDALKELFLLQNEDINLCINELKKLAILEKDINSDDIKEFVYGVAEISLEDFTLKLLNKEDIKHILKKMLERGSFDEVRILNFVTNFVEMLLEFHLYIKAYGKFDVVEILGYNLPKNLALSRANLSIKITPLQYEKMLFLLLDSEYLLKNAKNIEKSSILYTTLMKLQSFL